MFKRFSDSVIDVFKILSPIVRYCKDEDKDKDKDKKEDKEEDEEEEEDKDEDE